MTRILVCGDRDWTDKQLICDVLMDFWWERGDCVVIEGDCRGADQMAGAIAEMMGMEVKKFPADWDKYHKGAGPIRNQQMLDEGKPDIVLAFHSNIGESKGTMDMIRRANKAGLVVTLYPSKEQQ